MATEKKKSEEKHARYLVNPDTGHVELIHADDLDDKMAAGYSEPEGMMPNGQPINGDEPEDAIARDTQAEQARLNADWQSKKDEEKAKRDEESRKAQEEALANQPEHADMTVRVVEDKPQSQATAKKK